MSHIGVVDPKMLNVDPLVVAPHVPNLIIISDSSKVSGSSIEDGNKPLSPLFGGNTNVYVEGFKWTILLSGEDGIGPLLFYVTHDWS